MSQLKRDSSASPPPSGIVAFVVGTPLLLVAIGAVPSARSTTARADAHQPDDGTLALAVVAARRLGRRGWS